MDDDDSAGPLLGWSLGSMNSGSGRPIEELVQYPCVFRFKAVAKADPAVLTDLVGIIEGVVGRSIDSGAWSARDSSKGKYTCLTIDVWVETGEQVYAVYEALRSDARVTHLL